MRIFDLDGPVQRYGSMLFDLLVLNLLALFLSFGTAGLLLGISSMSLYHAVHQAVITGDGYAFKSFFHLFRKRFLTGTLLHLLLSAVFLVTAFNLRMLLTGVLPWSFLAPFYIFVLLEVLFLHTWLVPLAAHTELGWKDLLKFSFALSHKHLPTTLVAAGLNLVLLLLVLGMFLGVQQLGILFLFLPAFVALANSHLITVRILGKYNL
ncbi:DUF624 domain-containing protein [Anaerotalea alkaliphila]|uniref:DUF624 domain-containing protein n=1 Tax=Anaerotalea alkaliphila TaxID=2662126 RepID=A0A7X5HV49_9FIRM|nr:DUF624 domain-containing protein [Anaerotalea alkaliphila]NDL67225.1 DUF624 domain-containing protein [Anaerotalea alkaliphila]